MDQNKIRNIRIEDFDYPLPQTRIASHPLERRDACKLLRLTPQGEISHHIFSQLPELIPTDALLVCNNTRVINARMRFKKATGATIEIFLLEPYKPAEYNIMFQSHGPVEWECLIGNAKRWKEGNLEMNLSIANESVTLSAEKIGEGRVRLSWTPETPTLASVIEAAGKIPIPPYLNRESQESDTNDYQTVYSKEKGSVAAPTAGLHFTPELISNLKTAGIRIAEVSLHVGAGTFQPVKSEIIGEHPMHTEHFSISRETAEMLSDALLHKRPVIAVGTTSVRTLESLPYIGKAIREDRTPHVDQWEAYSDNNINATDALHEIIVEMDRTKRDILTCSTSIMIAPGFKWKITGGMITNFHQPQSTLLLLVSSFIDKENTDRKTWERIYREALDSGYRFLSYGDACLFWPLSS